LQTTYLIRVIEPPSQFGIKEAHQLLKADARIAILALVRVDSGAARSDMIIQLLVCYHHTIAVLIVKCPFIGIRKYLYQTKSSLTHLVGLL
jgi:hypothetical protein